MGPRLEGRGERTETSGRSTAKKSFNGAAAGRPRRVREKIADACRALAWLQWGRGWKAAERAVPYSGKLRAFKLQWGRGWKAAESCSQSRNMTSPSLLQWGRGWKAAESHR